MKKLFQIKKYTTLLLTYLLILSACPHAAMAQSGQTVSSPVNPLTINMTASGANCNVAQVCVWQKLPASSSTTSITLVGTFVGTISFEISADGGNTWIAASVASSSAVGTSTFGVAGFTDVRARCSAFTSGVITATIFSSQAGAGGGTGGAVTITSGTLSGNSSVSNGQWVQVGDVIWAQHTTQGIGSQTIHSSARIMPPGGTVSITNWDITCALSGSGGYGTGFTVTTAGWLQEVTTYLTSGNIPQGGDLINLYILNSMPAGGGTAGCVNVLVAANIGVVLGTWPSGSFLPVSFVGTTASFVSAWSIPGFTQVISVSNPAAGAEWAVNLGNAGRICVQAVSFQLVTSATVANRLPALRITDNVTSTFNSYWIPSVAQAASLTEVYSFAPGATNIVATLGAQLTQTVMFNNGPPICSNADVGGGVGGLSSGHLSIASATSALQAADQYSNIRLLVQIQQDNN